MKLVKNTYLKFPAPMVVIKFTHYVQTTVQNLKLFILKLQESRKSSLLRTINQILYIFFSFLFLISDLKIYILNSYWMNCFGTIRYHFGSIFTPIVWFVLLTKTLSIRIVVLYSIEICAEQKSALFYCSPSSRYEGMPILINIVIQLTS